MKKYLLGLIAVVFAIGFSSFSVIAKRTAHKFNIKSTVNLQTQADVINVDNWDYAVTANCTTEVPEEACTVQVDDTYSHAIAGGLRALNDAAYVQANPGASLATLTPDSYVDAGVTTYFIDIDGTIVTDTDNKSR